MHSLTWIATTKTSQWQSKDAATTSSASEGKWDVEVQLEKPLQTIDGFGACFNELGWAALTALDDKDKDEIFRELFAPGPKAGKYLKGAGFQWAGKRAIVGVHRRYPTLKLYQTEQECGDGKNDWRYCRYAWTLLKRFLENGVSAYHYWNIALKEGGVSRWGWAQNSLVTIDTATRTYKYNYEYYLLKHLSHFVKLDAKRLDTFTLTGYENLLAFLNPDESVVVLMQNDLCQDLPVRIKIGEKVIGATLEADSFNTFVVQA